MYLNIRKTSMDDIIRRASKLGKLIEHSYDQKFCEAVSLSSCGMASYTCISTKSIANNNSQIDAIGVFYDKPLGTYIAKELGRSIMEFKLYDSKTFDAICQLLAEIMPIKCGLLIDSFTYKIDNYWFLEIFNPKRYYLLRLRDPQVITILNKFAEEFTEDLLIAPNKAHENEIYKKYASILQPYFNVWDTEDITEEEMVTMKYREICKDKNIELNITVTDLWN